MNTVFSYVDMISSGFGHIVVIDSVLGKFGTKGKSSLAAAKFGVIGMMDSLRCEVRVTVIVSV